MITFVNAKLNLGLNVVERRADGYHNLETCFYPVGRHNGTPSNPEPFCDILEIVPAERFSFERTGRKIDCDETDDLAYRAARLFYSLAGGERRHRIILDKHLPDGAGLGGGSADASFVLKTLNEMEKRPLDDEVLAKGALSLGADCPFFIVNKPMFGYGVGEVLKPGAPDLTGWWATIVKPPVYVSTREAFSQIIPHRPERPLEELLRLPVREWRGRVVNDFEAGVFALHPELGDVKAGLYRLGAAYASMSGSGSSIYGLFSDASSARRAMREMSGPDVFATVCQL